MAWISYGDGEAPQEDNILRIHGVHPAVGRGHVDLYVELMRKPGPLTRTQRERIAELSVASRAAWPSNPPSPHCASKGTHTVRPRARSPR